MKENIKCEKQPGNKFYSGTKILSMKDINGKEPSIYVVEGNRVGGKTTFYYRWRIKKYLNNGLKTMWLYRFQKDIDQCADKIFKDIKEIYYPNMDMTYKIRGKGVYADLYLNECHCGYALPINSSDTIKNMSHIFTDVDWMLYDEFQPESGKYCPRELSKFQSIHNSIARGGGKQVRRVPVTLIGNTVSLLNPYYVSLGISNRVQDKTRYLRGNGYVYEKAIVKSAQESLEEDSFNKAFQGTYVKYASQGVYLKDATRGIEKLKGRSRYLATIYFGDKKYSLRYSEVTQYLYMCEGGDDTFPIRISLIPHDMEANTKLKTFYHQHIRVWRTFFETGRMRFEGLQEKECALELLSY